MLGDVELLVFLWLAPGMSHRNEGHFRGALEIEGPH